MANLDCTPIISYLQVGSETFYKEMSLRGYSYSEAFRMVSRYSHNKDVTRAVIDWNNGDKVAT